MVSVEGKAGFVFLGAGVVLVGVTAAVLPYLRRQQAAEDRAYNEAVTAKRNADAERAKWDAVRAGFNIIPGLGDLLFGKG